MKKLIYLVGLLLLVLSFSCTGTRQIPQPSPQFPKGEQRDTLPYYDTIPVPKIVPVYDTIPYYDTIPVPVNDTIPFRVPVYDTIPVFDYTYTLDAAAFGIQEGKVSDAQALTNRLALNKALLLAKAAGVKEFKIGALDAYFDADDRGIEVPGNFKLVMDSTTVLRAQPNNLARYALLSTYKSDSIYITGGTLVGERLEHTYSGSGSDEWGHLLDIKSSKHVTVDGVTMRLANGDGLVVSEQGYIWDDGHVYSEDITIINCRFIQNRRQGISLTSCKDVLIEKNHFADTGKKVGQSEGAFPKFAIDIEPYFENNADGTLKWYSEWVSDVLIRDNVEKGSVKGFVIVASGTDVVIEDNRSETQVGYSRGKNVIIRNNHIEDKDPEYGYSGIFGRGYKGANNEIYGNTVIGFDNPISLSGYDHNFHNNTVLDFKRSGFWARPNLYNSIVKGNTFKSSEPSGRGIFLYVNEVDNVVFEGNIIETFNNPVRFDRVNVNASDNSFILRGNTINGTRSISINDAKGHTMEGNTINGKTEN